jgi:hypothetical protein
VSEKEKKQKSKVVIETEVRDKGDFVYVHCSLFTLALHFFFSVFSHIVFFVFLFHWIRCSPSVHVSLLIKIKEDIWLYLSAAVRTGTTRKRRRDSERVSPVVASSSFERFFFFWSVPKLSFTWLFSFRVATTTKKET